jgi:large subunit ribosomal protein L22
MGISYSVEVDEERSAKAMGRELNVSKKDAVEVCSHIKGTPLREAQTTLRAVADGEEPVPLKRHNSGSGHTSGLEGWDAGGFPKNASEALLDVLHNAESNAENQGYDPDEMVVEHIAAHKVDVSRGTKPRAMGRASPWNSDLIDVEVVLLQEDYDATEIPEEETETAEESETEDVDETEDEETETSEEEPEAEDADGPETEEAGEDEETEASESDEDEEEMEGGDA